MMRRAPLRFPLRRAERMVMAAPVYYTADMVRNLMDELRPWPRYELVHGELLLSPAPRAWHQEIVMRLAVALRDFLEGQRVGHAFISPADLSWSDDWLVQPDVFVVRLDEARTMQWSGIRSLLLAAEVLSPSSLRADRFTKRRLYQELGVPQYWVIDADEQCVEVWTPDARFPVTERERVVWHPADAARAFTLELAELFRPI